MFAEGDGDGFSAVCGPDFCENGGDVLPDDSRRYAEGFSDVVVCESSCYIRDDILLSLGQDWYGR